MAGCFKAASAVRTVVPLRATAIEDVVLVGPSFEKAQFSCIYNDTIKLYTHSV